MMKEDRTYIPAVPRTAMEVHDMLPEGTLCEVIDNILYMSPAPTPNHQKILLTVIRVIDGYVEEQNLGELYVSPIDVYLDEENVIQPDILFIAQERLVMIRENGIYGSPDMIIEVLSSNRSHDTERKFSLYEQFGVQEYFIVDPETKAVLHYVLGDGKYLAKSAAPGELNSEVLGQSFRF